MKPFIEFFFSVAPNQRIGTIINVSILALLLAALTQIARAYRTLRANKEALDKLVNHLGRRPDRSTVLHAASSLPSTHLLRSRIENLRDLHQAGADIEPGVFSAFAIAELDRTAFFARGVSTSVVLLGLGGTLVGLSQAVISAQPMLASIVTGPQAIEAVIGTFSGLGTAFSTTLMGIISALALGIALGGFRSRQSQFLQQLEQCSILLIYPHFRTSPALAIVDAAKSLAALENRLDSSLVEIIGQLRTHGLALVKTIEDSVRHLVTEMGATGIALENKVSSSLEAVVDVTHKRGHALMTTLDKSFAALTEELREGTAQINQRLAITQQAMVELLGDPGADSRSLAQNIETIQHAVDAMNRVAAQMIQMTPAIEEAIARQVDRQSRDLHETMHSYTGQLATNVGRQTESAEHGFERLERVIANFGDALHQQQRSHDREVLTGVKDSVIELALTIKQERGTLDRLATASASLEASVRGISDRNRSESAEAESIQAAAGEFSGRLVELTTVVENLSSVVSAQSFRPEAYLPVPRRLGGDGAHMSPDLDDPSPSRKQSPKRRPWWARILRRS